MLNPSVCAAIGAACVFLCAATADAQPTNTNTNHTNTDTKPNPPADAKPAAASPTTRGAPLMDSTQSVHCVPDPDGHVWRIQCDETTKVCLYAHNRELDSRGKPIKSLERARRCAPTVDMSRAALAAKGYTLKPGRADAPYGWTRDDRGRVFQINFDLKRRLYLGSSYAPALKRHVSGSAETSEVKRSTVDFGLFIFDHWTGPEDSTRHRFRIIEGEVAVAPFNADLVLVHYDVSRRYPHPLLRVTTFFGEPRRHDLSPNIGFWFEGMRLESHQNAAADSNLWKFAAAHGTIDLWQSRRLDSYLRVRSGLGLERLYSDGEADRGALTWGSAVELDWVVDDSGFHNLRGEASYDRPRFFERQDGRRFAKRIKAEASYELVVIAINDQPVTARLAAKAERRDDIPGVEDRWGLTVGAGLRFSLWAPPRHK